MKIYLQLAMIAAFPVAVSVLLYFLEKKGCFSKLNYRHQQVLYGVVFGTLAILATEFGVDIGGAKANVRDASALIAGLCFGSPAGIIAGCIGGVERYFAAYWGAGTYTQIACTISTICAGLVGAFLRKFMFENRLPSVVAAFVVGIATETFHMLMIFLTNILDSTQAFAIAQKCTAPMVITNALAVMCAVLLLRLISGNLSVKQFTDRRITPLFQRSILLCVGAGFVFTMMFTFVVQYMVTRQNMEEVLNTNLVDVRQDVNNWCDENLLEIAENVAAEIDEAGGVCDFDALMEEYQITEINIIDENGVITETTEKNFLGYQMADGEQSSEFLVLLDGQEKEMVQSFQAISFDNTTSRGYAAAVLSQGGFVQVGYDQTVYQANIRYYITGSTRNRQIGTDGCIIVSDQHSYILSDRYGNEGKNLAVSGLTTGRIDGEGAKKSFTATVYGEESFCMADQMEGYYIVAVYPKSEANFSRNLAVYLTMYIEVLVFGVLFVVIFFLLKNLVIDNVNRINRDLNKITDGDLDVTVDVRTIEEFSELSDDINGTVQTLKHYIDQEKTRMDDELKFAESVQRSALLSVFPPFPDRKDIDLYACMFPAKKVGGDFYDFYFVGDNSLAISIADVSDKGVPAAMFMMMSKTLIKSYAGTGMDVGEAFIEANNKLCENNEANMFVTAWLGVIDLSSGRLQFANAGHELPIIRKSDGSCRYLPCKPGFVLAGMEDIPYKTDEVTLEANDTIYLYTDGVTEATNKEKELYGEDRLLRAMEALSSGVTAQQVCEGIKKDVDLFVADAPQFDDITMLAFTYKKEETK